MRSRKLIKGAFLNTLNLLAQILSGFYVMPLMIHAFGDANFGIWILVGSFMGFAAVLDLGLPTAVSRFISQAIGKGGKEGDQEIKLISATAFYIFIFITFLSLLIIALAIVFAPVFLKDAGQIKLFRTLLFILCLNNLFVFPTSVFEGILTANLRQDLISSRRIVFTVIRVALTIFLVKFNYGLVAIAWATVGCNIAENLARAVQSYQVDKRVSIAPANFKAAKVKQLFSYSVYTFIGRIADMLRFQINSFVITAFIDVASVTPFRIASRLIEYFMQFISAISGVFSPYFSQEEGRNNHESIKEKFLFITKITTYIATFSGLILLLYGKDFIYRWVGSQYSISYKILVILVIPLTFAMIQSAVFPLLYGISKHKFLSYMNVCEGILNLVLSIVLVKKFGVIGVAFGTAIPLLITKLLIQPVFVSRTLKIPLIEYFMNILVPLTISVLGVVFPWLAIAHFVKPVYKNLLFWGACQGSIFFLVVWFVGFTAKQKDYLKNILKLRNNFVENLVTRERNRIILALFLGLAFLNAAVILRDKLPMIYLKHMRKINYERDHDQILQKVMKKSNEWLIRLPSFPISDQTRLLIIDDFNRFVSGNKGGLYLSWPYAFLAKGLMDYDALYPSDGNLRILKDYLSNLVDTKGKIKNPVSFLDDVANGDVALYVYQRTGEKIYLELADDYFKYLEMRFDKEGKSISYRSDEYTRQLRYVDTLGLTCPFLVKYAVITNTQKAREMAIGQLREFLENGIDSNSGLPFHAYSLINKIPVGLLGWGRGTGWFALSLIESYLYLPDNEEFKDEIGSAIQKLANSLLRMPVGGGFNDIITVKNANYDSSTTALLLSFFVKSKKIGLIGNEFDEVILNAREKLEQSVWVDGTVDCAAGDTMALNRFSKYFGPSIFVQGMALSALSEFYKQDTNKSGLK